MADKVLLTNDGQYVTTVTMPPFDPVPEIICWGVRYFVLTASGEYREALIWHSTERARAR
jgi:hypothetical protein